MIPVLVCPILTKPELLDRMLRSVDVPVGLTLVVDNGGVVGKVKAHVIRLPSNIGVAASWNLALKATPRASWWLFVNFDVVFAKGDLATLAGVMVDHDGLAVLTNDGLSCFALSRSALQRVGYFDENFVPAYCEDADYERRCLLAGVPIVRIPTSNTEHQNSSTIRSDPHWERQNDRTYPANVEYYRRKWGADPRSGHDIYRTPFDEGGDLKAWTGDPARLAELAWETAALEPVGWEKR